MDDKEVNKVNNTFNDSSFDQKNINNPHDFNDKNQLNNQQQFQQNPGFYQNDQQQNFQQNQMQQANNEKKFTGRDIGEIILWTIVWVMILSFLLVIL